MLESYHLYANLAEGTAPISNQKTIIWHFKISSYGINLKWSVFVQRFPDPRGPKKYIAKNQKTCTKDIKRTCIWSITIQSRFAIFGRTNTFWSKKIDALIEERSKAQL